MYSSASHNVWRLQNWLRTFEGHVFREPAERWRTPADIVTKHDLPETLAVPNLAFVEQVMPLMDNIEGRGVVHLSRLIDFDEWAKEWTSFGLYANLGWNEETRKAVEANIASWGTPPSWFDHIRKSDEHGISRLRLQFTTPEELEQNVAMQMFTYVQRLRNVGLWDEQLQWLDSSKSSGDQLPPDGILYQGLGVFTAYDEYGDPDTRYVSIKRDGDRDPVWGQLQGAIDLAGRRDAQLVLPPMSAETVGIAREMV